MQIPRRKPGKYADVEPDYHITQEKFKELEKERAFIKEKKLPHARDEVKRLAEMGDFSENAAYQIAKGRLRRFLYRIDELNTFLKYAIIIHYNPNSTSVQRGNYVLLEKDNREITFRILGKEETDPSKGIISHRSKLGEALINKYVGDTIEINNENQTHIYTLKKIF